MFYVSAVTASPPAVFQTPLQERVYQTLSSLQIPFQRVDTEPAVTMEDCAAINAVLQMQMVKTLFLCNRQKTAFYLLVTLGEKPFRAKELSAALGISRLSFAPVERMEPMLGTTVGAATIFSCLLDRERALRPVIDREILDREWYGCSDGTTTSYLKLPTQDILHRFLPYTGHTPDIIEV